MSLPRPRFRPPAALLSAGARKAVLSRRVFLAGLAAVAGGGLYFGCRRTHRPLQVTLRHTLLHDGWVMALAFAPDSQTLATGAGEAGHRGEAWLWDVETGRERAALGRYAGSVYAVAYSPDGQTVATGGWDGVPRLWDVMGERPPRVLTNRGGPRCITSLAFSADGRILVAPDPPPRAWDVEAGREREPVPQVVPEEPPDPFWDPLADRSRGSLADIKQAAHALSVSPNGRWLATANRDFSVELWDLRKRRLHFRGEKHTDLVCALAFTPDSRILVTGSHDGTVLLWDAAAGKDVVSLTEHRGTVYAVSVSPDGRWLTTASHDQTARLWELTPAAR